MITIASLATVALSTSALSASSPIQSAYAIEHAQRLAAVNAELANLKAGRAGSVVHFWRQDQSSNVANPTSVAEIRRILSVCAIEKIYSLYADLGEAWQYGAHLTCGAKSGLPADMEIKFSFEKSEVDGVWVTNGYKPHLVPVPPSPPKPPAGSQ